MQLKKEQVVQPPLSVNNKYLLRTAFVNYLRATKLILELDDNDERLNILFAHGCNSYRLYGGKQNCSLAL